jgi:serine protease Do
MLDSGAIMGNELVNLSNELAGAVERAAAGVVTVHARPRIGSSGIVWAPNLILTSSQGIRFEEGIKVLFPDGRGAEARLRGRDHGTDLALLEVDTGSTKPLEVVSDAGLKAGQLVLAVGRTSDTGPIASFGIVSGVAGEWKSWRGGKVDRFVRLDVSVYPTSSGGAAVDASGNVFGVVSTGLSRTSVLAVTRTTIDRVARNLQEKGYVSHGFLGITLQPVALPRDVKEKLQVIQESGIMILGLEPDGPAAKGGLIMGDVLLSAGGEALRDPETLAEVLERTAAGGALDFRVLRAGVVHELTVHAGERPRRGK